jgi:hypothetical protein
MGEFEVKKETKYEVDTHDDIKDDIGDAGDEVREGAEDSKDKLKAGAKAVFNKAKDPDRDLELEYNKEKIKEKVD